MLLSELFNGLWFRRFLCHDLCFLALCVLDTSCETFFDLIVIIFPLFDHGLDVVLNIDNSLLRKVLKCFASISCVLSTVMNIFIHLDLISTDQVFSLIIGAVSYFATFDNAVTVDEELSNMVFASSDILGSVKLQSSILKFLLVHVFSFFPLCPSVTKLIVISFRLDDHSY